MNWFGFAPGREGMLVETDRNDGAHDGSPAMTVAPRVEAPGVAGLLAALAALGAVPNGLAPRVEEVLREVALRHPGALQVVDAVSTGGASGAAVVLVVERAAAPEVTVDDVARRFSLTRRQASVALLLARRHSNAEIARMLAVSPHTARHHTERVLERLGVSSRMDVARLVLGGR